ncbi:MAG: rhomboid family intramembrane serine protease [Paludisphaera borealis]|uniref:rhomboid family intramembrane serine protease n=1 Tax=Paludisphaera borealis TaxID=1387353 RepID=UPI00284F268A|nr:rhomboid family intramembrane serine protease [Paludisphaera borealis]MDR3619008.1 rhomboid family intramembrane serine protease [Paludisphaera borealis]
MILRTAAREIRDYPATAVFCASWIAVFAAMVVTRYGVAPPTFWRLAVLGIGEAHRFGDLTLRDLSNGEVWRLMTCNFVHYSLIHIGMNLFAFYILGTLLESWYGSWQLVAIYGAAGVGGNLLSAMVRYGLGSNPLVHSGGGSVVIMGLIGFCATAGWRSRSGRDRDLTWQMVKALAITGALGIAFPRYIDNWGHAGGALIGLPLGLTHRSMLARRGRPGAWGVGVATSLVIVASVFAQARSDRQEAQLRLGREIRAGLDESTRTMRLIQVLRQWAEQGGDGRLIARVLESQAAALDRPPTTASYQRLHALAVQAAERKLTEAETQAFRDDLAIVQKHQRGELNARQRAFWDYQRKSGKRDEPSAVSRRVPS